MIGLLSAVAVVTLWVAASIGGPSVPTRTAVVQVHDGQTLSQIATESAPGADVSTVVSRIRALNGLASSAVRPGQTLVVPSAHPSRR